MSEYHLSYRTDTMYANVNCYLNSKTVMNNALSDTRNAIVDATVKPNPSYKAVTNMSQCHYMKNHL